MVSKYFYKSDWFCEKSTTLGSRRLYEKPGKFLFVLNAMKISTPLRVLIIAYCFFHMAVNKGQGWDGVVSCGFKVLNTLKILKHHDHKSQPIVFKTKSLHSTWKIEMTYAVILQ